MYRYKQAIILCKTKYSLLERERGGGGEREGEMCWVETVIERGRQTDRQTDTAARQRSENGVQN